MPTKKWLIIGGSYPGAFVAWFKHLYPDYAMAAWSSSGVINPIQKFTDFDMDIYLSTEKSMNNCSEKIAMMTTDIER